jgi:hypothetical protein
LFFNSFYPPALLLCAAAAPFPRRHFLLMLINKQRPGFESALLNRSCKESLLKRPHPALYILHQPKVYKVPSISTIVLIGNIQSIRNKRKMAKPEITFKVGAVRASVFRNIIEKNGRSIPLPKVVIEVRYKDKTGQWNGTNSLSLNDLPKAVLALQKAFEYLVEHKQPEQDESSEMDA